VKIAERYSHLNGLEFLLVHKRRLWQEIERVVSAVDARACRTKESREKRMKGKLLYSPAAMNASFKVKLKRGGWERVASATG
jgi:hypothetical protein